MIPSRSRRHGSALPALFEEYGLPRRIRNDNVGTVCLVDQAPSRSIPASRSRTAGMNRMHRILKTEATIPPERDIRAQQRRLTCSAANT